MTLQVMKKETKVSHTPEPWEILSGYKKPLSIWGADKQLIVARIHGDDYVQRGANAKLIAAAPELLAACVEFVRKVECGEARSTRSYKQMKEAIEKATPFGVI